MNSPDSMNKFGVSTQVFHMMTCTSETEPVLTQYDSCQIRSKLMRQNTCINSREYTCSSCCHEFLNEFDMSRTGSELVLFHWYMSSCEKLVISR